MLFKKITVGFVIAALFLLSACAFVKGNIVVLKNKEETELTMELTAFNAGKECRLSLKERDTLQIDISLDSGSIGLEISGINGSQPYTGNDLESALFTVTVSETDEYVFRITGNGATGKVIITNLGNKEK
mgnify:CR=1 FL=1